MAAAILRTTTRRAPMRTIFRSLATADGYLHKTKIPTMHFQDSLPRLPIPKLEDTCERYLASAAPLVSSAEFSSTQQTVKEFISGVGEALQTELKENDKKQYSSFISAPWFDMYLENRDPVVINVTPQLTFKDDPTKLDQAQRTASLVYSAALFYRTLRDRQLSPDVFHTQPKKSQTGLWESVIGYVPRSISFYGAYAVGAYPLDMSQYNNLFQSTRLPEVGRDTLQTFKDTKHIVVQRGSQFFSVDVLTDSGTAIPPETILAEIQAILRSPLETADPVGVLTAGERDSWALTRKDMEKDGLNRASLHTIDSALFAVCLEDESPQTDSEICRLMLHGNARNRWYDKSIQLIVTPNGKAGLNFEHSWGDGVAVLRFFNEIYEESLTHDTFVAGGTPTPTPLSWNLSDGLKSAVSTAEATTDALISSVELSILESPILNSKFLRSHKLSPDGTMQMIIQLGHYLMYGENAATYESANTSAFKHGRTETIRSLTSKSNEFCKAMVDPSCSREEKETAMRAAIDNHAQITKQALMGKGWDRHLFALRRLAEAKSLSVPLFSDPTYKRLCNIILSTSTLASPALESGGFGPVSPDCYGIGYSITNEGCRFGVTSYFRKTPEFVGSLESAATMMREIVEQGAESSGH